MSDFGRSLVRPLVLLDATEDRLEKEGRSKPPAFLIYIGHGEELYVRAGERQRRRFSAILANGLSDPRMRAMMSMRADFLGELQGDEPLFAVHRLINVPPLREAELREVVSRPAELLSAQFETPGLVDIITRRTAEESVRDAGALPLLSYMLDDMWTQMVRRGDGILRLPAQGFEIGGVLVDRANNFLATHPSAEAALRRILTLHCVTVPDDGQPMRRIAAREGFTEEEWQVVSELADYPYRLFVTVTTVTGETYAELAHEAIIRRWDKLREWIAAEREFLAWRSGLEAARRAWQGTPNASKYDALLMGAALTQAQSWLGKRAQDLPGPDREFITLSIEQERKAQARARRVRALVYVLLVGIIAGLVGWINQEYIEEQWTWYAIMRPYMLANVRPYVLTAEAERVLRPLESFRECAKDCPEMIVIPPGEFDMGSPLTEQGRHADEGPQHKVMIARPFAMSRFDVTFDDWDACVSVGGCPQVGDGGMGRGRRPVILVNWYDARQYVAWFSQMTGQPYRLLTEAEWEYAARAGTMTAYSWGDEIGKGNANCNGCGSQWDGRETSPVGSFKRNAFGLYDMAGNVFQWVQDCYHDDYDGAPKDGSAWASGDCSTRVVRGGSWFSPPQDLRAASRRGIAADSRAAYVGFRIGRTLTP